MSLVSVCAEIARVVGDPALASGVKTSLNSPPDVIGQGQYPLSWVNPVGGRVTPGDEDEALWVHQVELIVYVRPRVANLPVEFADVAPLVNSVERAIRRAWVLNQFAPGIDRCVVASYSIGLRDFGGGQHSVTFTLDVKEHSP